ncbi:sensor histidine kinase colocalized with HrtAB transporter [Bacillus sp. JCM 19045]|nr:sensor histidine kinase colocalized with HrtAB transporter [Bacillus sp. JCM 19045]
MKTLYVRIVLTTLAVMALSSLVSFLLTNVYYQLYLKPENAERLTEMANEVQAFVTKTDVDAELYLTHLGELGYQLAIFDEQSLEPVFYGEAFREQTLQASNVQEVLAGGTYSGVSKNEGQLFVTGFFNNELSNSIGVPITINNETYALFIRPSIEQQLGEFREFLAILITFIILFSILLVFVSTRYIVSPIEQLTRATKRLSKVQFDVVLPTNRKDEIGQLALQFSKMMKEWQQLEGMRQEFVANVSHEIQSPLTTIQGMTTALADKDLSIKQKAYYLEQINLESKRLSSLSRQLLMLASLENSGPEMSEVSLNQQWKEVIQATAFKWREKELYIESDLPSLEVSADAQLLYQVWLNLFTNALKFSHHGGTISIEGRRTSSHTEIKITDNGQGISEAAQPYIFERFFKEDQARTSEKSNNGLGLAIVAKIVKLHGGTIDVTSEKGKGAMFIVRLPHEK